MKVLMISADPRILIEGTDAAQRMREYADLFDELAIIVLTRAPGEEKKQGNLFLYPAWGRTPFARMRRAWRIANSLKGRFEVVSGQGADETGLLAYVLSRRNNIPFQLQIHTDVFSPWYRRASWKERMRYALARFLIPRADCIRTVSERIRRSLLQPTTYNLQPKKISMLPIFTDVSRFSAAFSDQETERRFEDYDLKMVAVGRFVEKEKNFCLLIEVMREFIKVCPRALLVIVGEGPDRERYQLQAISYKLEKNIIIEPWRNDLPSFLKSFDLFLLSSWYEGWGRAVIEAMAAGLPIVMTDTGLASEVVKNGENGIVVPVGDAPAFFRAIQTLYEDPHKRKRLADAGRETIKNLKPVTRAEYLIHYRKCIESCVENDGIVHCEQCYRAEVV